MNARHRLELVDWPRTKVGVSSPNTRITLRIEGDEIVMALEDEDWRLDVWMGVERAESVRDWLNMVIELVKRKSDMQSEHEAIDTLREWADEIERLADNPPAGPENDAIESYVDRLQRSMWSALDDLRAELWVAE